MLRLAPPLTLTLLIGPVLAGLIGVLALAFGYFPALGGTALSLDAFAEAMAAPGFARSAWLGYWVGLAATAIGLLVLALFLAGWWGTRPFAPIAALASPLMAVPHAATAFGLAFLIVPSGWLMRLISPWATGLDRPPDWLIVNDPAGWALLAGLVIKEMPYLLLMALAAIPQTAPAARLNAARAMGYGRVWGFLTAVFPGVYAQIRLPVYAVIAFSTSVVDMALILGPGTPPTLAVQILRWHNDPDLDMRFVAAAAAVCQLGVTAAALLTWWLGEKAVAWLGRKAITMGRRYRRDSVFRVLGFSGFAVIALTVLLGLIALFVWSVAGFWRFPDALPDRFDLMRWVERAPLFAEPVFNASLIGLAAAGGAMVLVLASLENGHRRGLTASTRALTLLYLPLIVPQIAFVFGLLILALWLGFAGQFWAVALAHLVFVTPYVYLSLADPYEALDRRYFAVARSLGKSPARVFFTIRLPLMLRPVLTAFAIGFAISIAQYLPTQLIGAGRWPTVTTEAVALAAGNDRRVIGSLALIQSLLPAIALGLAALVPALLFRHRRGMQH
ncbi:ABC transporter permease [Cucumibacter marinus]|uniref:ABC transporter permease n=1 Tax=Cucumibacter marinus TaxID=1121252 RepID=UPI00042603DA|nr:ABC transporter permease subunit [Cucumibacter marinus]